MSTNPQFGRKWKIMVLRADGSEAWVVSDSDFEKNALRCTFSIEQIAYQTPWYSDIQIWNLAGDTQAAIFEECKKDGSSVIVEAGYQDGRYGKIFDGQIFQPLFERVGVIDYVLTLHCMDGLGVVTGNLCNMTLSRGYDYAGIISEMARKARTPVPVEFISENLDKNKLPRGKVISGDFQNYVRDIARANNAQFFMKNGKLNVNKLDDPYEGEAIVYTPESGLIGTPQQITNGVSFRVLLNPELQVKIPYMTVKIDNAIIQQIKLRQDQIVSPLDQNGFYKVIKVTYNGDTRGNDWYADIIGINLVGNVTALYGDITS